MGKKTKFKKYDVIKAKENIRIILNCYKEKMNFIFCPVCTKAMVVGFVDGKVVACCKNKKCESVLVYGDPVQKAFGVSRTNRKVKKT